MTTWPISDPLRAYLDVQYELLRVLGTGGMGAVLLARERALERLVAIKVLHPSAATDAEARERFRREARTAARLTHPHIVPLHTFGEVAGELYFVMGFVEGETLAARLQRESRLSADDTARIVAEIADALDYAHRAGTVHRDLKPENILLDSASGRAMLTDFGIARDVGAASSLTSTGVIVGTPHYMSPEQASGERAIDGRSDIYSLGVIAYRMLSGSLPFGGANAREVLTRHITAAAAPLPEALREEAPLLVGAVTRALAKQPGERWATAGDLAVALRSGGDDAALGEEFEQWDSAIPQVVLTAGVAGAAFPLAWLVGWVEGPFTPTLLAWFASIGIGTVTTAVAARVSSRRGDPSTRALRWRLALRPAKWWPVWWPKRWRRPGDVWDRLPRELRRIRWANFLSAAIVLPLQVGGLLWLFSPRGEEALAQVLMTTEKGAINLVVSAVVALAFASVVGMIVVGHRLKRRLGLDDATMRVVASMPPADPRWKQPRYARLLEPAPAPGARDVAKGIDALLQELQGAGVALPDGIVTARASAQRAVATVDRELSALREMVNAEEIERLDARLAALGSGDEGLRQMLTSQRELLVRAESRIAELGALRTRLEAQQGLLYQQLVALRELAPSGGDLSEVTGRLREVNDDLRRLAEGLQSV